MISAQHASSPETRGPASPIASAMAPHRGDVTTVRAAARVRLQVAERVEALRAQESAAAVPLPCVGWTGQGPAAVRLP